MSTKAEGKNSILLKSALQPPLSYARIVEGKSKRQ